MAKTFEELGYYEVPRLDSLAEDPRLDSLAYVKEGYGWDDEIIFWNNSQKVSFRSTNNYTQEYEYFAVTPEILRATVDKIEELGW